MRYIDADALIEEFDKTFLGNNPRGVIRGTIENAPTAVVVERRENPIDAEEVYWHFKDVDGHKNLVIRLKGMFTDITDIRIRLDKYSLKELVKGEWIVLYDEDSPQDGVWKCSMCDYIRFIDDITPTNYCPNYGADMTGKKLID